MYTTEVFFARFYSKQSIMFESTLPGPPDPMFTLKKLADCDISPNKVDLGVGVYRNERAEYHELESIKRVYIPYIPRAHPLNSSSSSFFPSLD